MSAKWIGLNQKLPMKQVTFRGKKYNVKSRHNRYALAIHTRNELEKAGYQAKILTLPNVTGFVVIFR